MDYFQCSSCLKFKKSEFKRDIGTAKPVCPTCADKSAHYKTEAKRLALGKIAQRSYATGHSDRYFDRVAHDG